MKWVLNDGHVDVATLTVDSSTCFEAAITTHHLWVGVDIPKSLHEGDLFLGDLIIKPDGCSHWYFLGEDYLEDKEINPYYHLCGSDRYITFMACLWFAWRCAEEYYNDRFDEHGKMDIFDGVFSVYTIRKDD